MPILYPFASGISDLRYLFLLYDNESHNECNDLKIKRQMCIHHTVENADQVYYRSLCAQHFTTPNTQL